MIRAAENYTVRVRGDFWIRAKRPVKGGLKNLVETMNGCDSMGPA